VFTFSGRATRWLDNDLADSRQTTTERLLVWPDHGAPVMWLLVTRQSPPHAAWTLGLFRGAAGGYPLGTLDGRWLFQWRLAANLGLAWAKQPGRELPCGWREASSDEERRLDAAFASSEERG
jgi:hypothetical protein